MDWPVWHGGTALQFGAYGLNLRCANQMWYFAYGSNLNSKAVADWCRRNGHKPPAAKGRPAILDNYRLCFPIYSYYWKGGTADVVYDPGKYVAGALFELTDAEMTILDQKVNRTVDGAGKESGLYARIEVTVSPLGKGQPVQAVTYQGTNPDRFHIPPSRQYMDMVIQAAYQFGLSLMWISYLQSFATQDARITPAEQDASRSRA